MIEMKPKRHRCPNGTNGGTVFTGKHEVYLCGKNHKGIILPSTNDIKAAQEAFNNAIRNIRFMALDDTRTKGLDRFDALVWKQGFSERRVYTLRDE